MQILILKSSRFLPCHLSFSSDHVLGGTFGLFLYCIFTHSIWKWVTTWLKARNSLFFFSCFLTTEKVVDSPSHMTNRWEWFTLICWFSLSSKDETTWLKEGNSFRIFCFFTHLFRLFDLWDQKPPWKVNWKIYHCLCLLYSLLTHT